MLQNFEGELYKVGPGSGYFLEGWIRVHNPAYYEKGYISRIEWAFWIIQYLF